LSLMFVACIWTAVSPNISSLRASRVFHGFGLAALPSLFGSTIEQLFFVHERGNRSVIWSFTILSGVNLGPLLYSYVIQNLSWQMGFWFVSIPLGICLVLVFFFVPETTYTCVNREESTSITNDPEETGVEDKSLPSVGKPIPRKSYVSQLRIWNGVYSQENILKIFLRPFPFLLSPVAWFVFFVYGMQTVFVFALSISTSTIFTIEYNFTPTQIGLTNLGGLVGIVLATCISGRLTDWGTVWLARRNQGVYEPEFRIFFSGAMLFGAFGYAGWAVGYSHNMPWIGAVACIALIIFSLVVSASATITYLLDTHGGNALHAFALTNFMKNMVLYGFTFFTNGMVLNRGVKVSLLVLAACQAFCFLMTIPMYRYGKRARAFISRHPSLAQEPGVC